MRNCASNHRHSAGQSVSLDSSLKTERHRSLPVKLYLFRSADEKRSSDLRLAKQTTAMFRVSCKPGDIPRLGDMSTLPHILTFVLSRIFRRTPRGHVSGSHPASCSLYRGSLLLPVRSTPWLNILKMPLVALSSPAVSLHSCICTWIQPEEVSHRIALTPRYTNSCDYPWPTYLDLRHARHISPQTISSPSPPEPSPSPKASPTLSAVLFSLAPPLPEADPAPPSIAFPPATTASHMAPIPGTSSCRDDGGMVDRGCATART